MSVKNASSLFQPVSISLLINFWLTRTYPVEVTHLIDPSIEGIECSQAISGAASVACWPIPLAQCYRNAFKAFSLQGLVRLFHCAACLGGA